LRLTAGNINWEDPEAVGRLRIADLACGTGTLLMAAVQAIVDNYMRTATPPQPAHRQQLLKALLEEGVYGLDVLQSAVHLTASTLALPIPEVMARGMRLYTMPLGFVRANGREVPRFGSLDLLSDAPVAPNLSLFPELGGQTAERATDAQRQPEQLRLPPLDLVCMNPPFTRTCGDNLLFGSLPKTERTRMQKAFQEWCKQQRRRGVHHGGAGRALPRRRRPMPQTRRTTRLRAAQDVALGTGSGAKSRELLQQTLHAGVPHREP
jgi:hypothetical protein